MESINKIINDFAVKLVNDLRKSLKEKKVTYGGGQESRLGASIKYNITYPKNDLKLDISMNDYWKFVDKGRGTGPDDIKTVKKAIYPRILPWVKKKGIARPFAQEKKMPFDRAAKTLAFLISRKISKKGYKGNYFFTEVINDGRQEILAQQIRQQYGKEIKNNLDTWQSQ